MSKDRKVVLIIRRTRLQELIAQYNTEGQAAFVIESRGQDFKAYQEESTVYLKAVAEVEAKLQRCARVHILDRDFLPNFIFGPEDIVVVVGPDGLVANTLKYLKGQPLIAINPDPQRIDGVLLPFEVNNISAIFADVVRQSYQSKHITMAKATLNDGQELIAVNDLFIGPRFQISARYELTVDDHKEEQSSSGVIVSTGLGSTGWLKSVIAGAMGIAGRSNVSKNPIPWDADYLTYAVREPFASQTTATELVFGELRRQSDMRIASRMAVNGVIFSDGIVDDYIDFNIGAEAQLSLAERQGVLVV